jgi:hypothetical protein
MPNMALNPDARNAGFGLCKHLRGRRSALPFTHKPSILSPGAARAINAHRGGLHPGYVCGPPVSMFYRSASPSQ